jgi:hypothetical protein
MWRNRTLFWLMFAAAGLGVWAGLSRPLPADIGSRVAAGLMLVSAVIVAVTSWRLHGLWSRDGLRWSAYIAGMSCFALSTFLATGIPKFILLGISMLVIFAVIVDQLRARRRRTAI